MSSIHLASRGQSLGVFSEEEVREGLRTKRFSGEELVWKAGMTDWQLLKEMVDIWEWKLSTDGDESTSADRDLLGEASVQLAWEQREQTGFFVALFQTIAQVLLQPTKTFEGLKKVGGLVRPLFYYVLIGSVTLAVAVGAQLPSLIKSMAVVMPQFENISLTPSVIASLVLVAAILFPLFYTVTIFLSSFLTHLFLKIIGRTKEPFAATFRVLCYAAGSTMIFQVIPFGGIVTGIWKFYASLIGLKKVHQVSGWRVTFALILTPIILFVLALAFGSLLYMVLPENVLGILSGMVPKK